MSRERGRPRSFDVDVALDGALKVFWKNGFQHASLHDLTEAMALSKPSVYAAFGDKEALYLKALGRYVDQHLGARIGVLEAEPDARRAVDLFLHAVAAMMTDPALPGGCFIINGTADLGGAATPVAVETALRAARADGEARLQQRLVRAQHDGQLGAQVPVEALAAAFATLMAGLGVLAKAGASQAKLDGVIALGMQLWPGAH